MKERIYRLLTHRRLPLVAVLLGVLLALPSLGAGFIGDDYFHREVLLGVGLAGENANPIMDLFAFVPGDERNQARADSGTIDWWAPPGIKASLFRPAAALTHMLDYALWPDTPALHHVHSLLWLALALATVSLLYRRTMALPVSAGLATLLFALEDSHAMPASWLANRHALMSLVFGTLCLIFHQRWREGGKWGQLLLAMACLTVGLCCGEATLGAVAYLAAWELLMGERRWLQRLGALVPYGVLILVWALIYSKLGYGAYGSGLYIDPVREPFVFLAALAERWPTLQFGQWFQAPIDIYLLLTRKEHLFLAGFSIAMCLALAWQLYPLLRKRTDARFWALGMSLSLIPLCGAFPMDRLLVFAGVGAFALMALLVEEAIAWVPQPAGHGLGRTTLPFVVILLLLHVGVAVPAYLARSSTLPILQGIFAAGARSAPIDEAVANQTFVIINGNDFPNTYTVVIRTVDGKLPAPRRMAMLATLTHQLTIHREDADTLVITTEGGYLAEPVDQLLRSTRLPFHVGERFERPDFTAEVRTITHDGRPEEVAFYFRAPLEDPSYRWLQWGDAGFKPFHVPSVGETMVLPPVLLRPVFREPGEDPTTE